jgi:mRNA interferase RelE/StbE
MRYEIILAPEAVQDLRRLRAYDRAIVRDGLETHLRHEPTKASKARIKRLRRLVRPQYRLRLGDWRVFYDVSASEVQILAVVTKSEVEQWLQEVGKRE